MICSRCVYDDSIPGITFDAKGICSYCHLHDKMDKEYPTGPIGRSYLESFAKRIKEDGQGKPFDCVVGVSGGCDSTLTLLTAYRLGLRIAAVHFDNGWNSPVAEMNMKSACNALGVPLLRLKVNQDEFDSINKAFLRSGTRDFEAPTDIGLTTTLYRFAQGVGTRWILNGHSFRTEGVAPLGWSYMDGRYIADVCARFGGPRQFKTFPNLWLRDFLRWSLMGFKRWRPLYYLDYNKDQVKAELSARLGWQWYGGHHLESDITAFFMWMTYQRWGIDFRKLGFAAQVRSRDMRRADALDLLGMEPTLDDAILQRIAQRLGENGQPLRFDQPKRTERDFRTYKFTFELLRPLFYQLMRQGKVPQSFYVKYCLSTR